MWRIDWEIIKGRRKLICVIVSIRRALAVCQAHTFIVNPHYNPVR